MKPAPDQRIAELDGLRGVAIGLVLCHHLIEGSLPSAAASPLGWVKAALSLSWSGVDLFFVLSGYFIGGILLDHRQAPRLTKTFYLRRALRILPLYYVTLALTLALVAIHLPGSRQLFPAWVYGFFLSNFAFAWTGSWDWYPLAVLWSLAVEEQFYLAAPWIARWIPPARIPLFLLSLIVGAWLLRTVLYLLHPANSLAWQVLMPARMDTLAAGVLLAWAARTENTAPFFRRLATTWRGWLAAGGVLLVLLTLNRRLYIESSGVYYGYTILAAFYTLLLAIVAVVRPPGLVRFFAFAPLVSLGRHSYFIYLWHMLIGWGIIQWLAGNDFVLNSPAGLALVALAIGATWLAGVLSWKFFEGPIVRLGRRYTYTT